MTSSSTDTEPRQALVEAADAYRRVAGRDKYEAHQAGCDLLAAVDALLAADDPIDALFAYAGKHLHRAEVNTGLFECIAAVVSGGFRQSAHAPTPQEAARRLLAQLQADDAASEPAPLQAVKP